MGSPAGGKRDAGVAWGTRASRLAPAARPWRQPRRRRHRLRLQARSEKQQISHLENRNPTGRFGFHAGSRPPFQRPEVRSPPTSQAAHRHAALESPRGRGAAELPTKGVRGEEEDANSRRGNETLRTNEA